MPSAQSRGAKRLLSSSTFRLALLYVAVFAASTVALLAFIWWSTAATMARQADETIRAEITGLAERYRLSGLAGLVDAIDDRLARNPQGNAIYVLVDRSGRPVVGNLSAWPRAAPDPSGWVEFALHQAAPEGERPHRARARTFRLQGGFRLLAGRDMHELDRARTRIAHAVGWSLGLMILLALAGAWIAARGTVRRLEAMNETTREIMEGDLSRRVEVTGSGDEHDRLAHGLNRMLDRIEELMEGVRRVSDNVAHDLRTPLTRLRNRLEHLRRDQRPDPGELDQALAEADGLLATFNALLRIARIESGAQRAAFGRVDLSSLLDDVVDLYEPLAEDRDQRIETGAEPGLAVEGDRDMLFQAIANLLDNAVRHGHARGAIRIAAERAGDRVRVRVADEGPGIPPARRERVLERFARLDPARGPPGNGLGLSLVAAVARVHGAGLHLGGDDTGLVVELELAAWQESSPGATSDAPSRHR